MAKQMEPNLLTKKDICETFLITLMYGEKGARTHDVIAACKIILNDDEQTVIYYKVFRKIKGNHADIQLIEYLQSDKVILKAGKIKIEVYINYSPCNACAEAIRVYVEEMTSQKKEITMEIVFANFYKATVYPGNNKESADKNKKGLKDLNECGVKLKLLGVHVKWEEFLGSDFFELFTHEKKVCLNRANSDKRKEREVEDQMVWKDIFGIEVANAAPLGEGSGEPEEIARAEAADSAEGLDESLANLNINPNK